MSASFPQIQMRSREDQLKLLDIPEYIIDTIEEDGVICGFIALWRLEQCVFIEHIAIDPKMRGRQLGRTILERLIDKSDKPVVLEVEEPCDEIAKKRIGFYEKSGFKLCYFDYFMPPLQQGFEPLPLMIMSYPEELTASEFEPLRHEIYRKVYNID